MAVQALRFLLRHRLYVRNGQAGAVPFWEFRGLNKACHLTASSARAAVAVAVSEAMFRRRASACSFGPVFLKVINPTIKIILPRNNTIATIIPLTTNNNILDNNDSSSYNNNQQ